MQSSEYGESQLKYMNKLQTSTVVNTFVNAQKQFFRLRKNKEQKGVDSAWRVSDFNGFVQAVDTPCLGRRDVEVVDMPFVFALDSILKYIEIKGDGETT